MVRIEHSVFALPFAYSGAFLADNDVPSPSVLLALTIAMVGIRSFAMGVNRITDLPFDAKNPRTANRPLVTGEISLRQARIFCAIMAALFVAACAALNSLCLTLSPLPLILAVLYSYSKRFTRFCHFLLGAVIGLAPIAGWLSVSPAYALPPLLLGLAVAFWIAGFDILYAAQDIAFDREQGLFSLPARSGPETAFAIAAFAHCNTVIFLFLAGLACGLSPGWHLCLGVCALIFFREHSLASAASPERLRLAFAMNGPVSLLLLGGTLLGIFWR
ncbi:MAG: putative 4-hydroxybenzoate polyprenyltransferase [Desulfovibrio sp.]|jgi:4-hydroxybenzoate polyprenyltransferase|nr:putative 4-hydroxybenzoate polyprenyltransferase [Desulfovibrio sp.]